LLDDDVVFVAETFSGISSKLFEFMTTLLLSLLNKPDMQYHPPGMHESTVPLKREYKNMKSVLYHKIEMT